MCGCKTPRPTSTLTYPLPVATHLYPVRHIVVQLISAAVQISGSTTMLGQLKEAYEDALLSSSSTLTSVESTLRNLTWFLPGRFEDAEIASEGCECTASISLQDGAEVPTHCPLREVYSALSVVSLYHDSVIAKRLNRISALPPSPFPPTSTYSTLPPSPPLSELPADASSVPPQLATSTPSTSVSIPPASDHARYTQHFCESSTTYRRAGKSLVLLQYVQLLLEMVWRKRRGDRKRWTLLIWLELIKSVVITPLKESRGRRPAASLPNPLVDQVKSAFDNSRRYPPPTPHFPHPPA